MRMAGIILAIVVFLLLFQAKPWEPAPPSSAPLSTVTIALVKKLNFLPGIAWKGDWFNRGGLSVKPHFLPTGKKALRDLSSGQSDLAVVGLGPLVFAAFDKQPVRIIASIATLFDIYKVVARKEREILRPADLKGRRVAVTRGSSMHYFLHHFLIENSLSTDDVELVFVTDAQNLTEALKRGEIDAFCGREPFISQAIRDVPGGVSVFSAPHLPANTLNLVTSAAYLEKHPQEVSATLKALHLALAQTQEDPEGALRLLASDPEMAPDLALLQAQNVQLMLNLDQGLVLEMEGIARWAIRNVLTDKMEIPDFMGILHTRTLEMIDEAAVSVIH